MGDTIVKPGDVLTITRSIRSAKDWAPPAAPGHLRQRDREPRPPADPRQL